MANEIKISNEEKLAEWLNKWKIEVVERWSKYFNELLNDETFTFILNQWYELHLREQDQRARRIKDIIKGEESFLGRVDEYNSKRCYAYSDIITDIFNNKEEGNE